MNQYCCGSNSRNEKQLSDVIFQVVCPCGVTMSHGDLEKLKDVVQEHARQIHKGELNRSDIEDAVSF